MSKTEYGKRCQRCWKYARSRMYYHPIGGKYLRLCSECWNIVEAALERIASAMEK